jgi:PIN domain nuclease of toxin-antitoxin system
MRLLVDTHLLLWAAASSRRLAAGGAPALLRPALDEMGFSELPVTGAHAERLASLPPIHKDPFDRMLVAQSLAEPLVLLTNDGVLSGYGDVVRVV